MQKRRPPTRNRRRLIGILLLILLFLSLPIGIYLIRRQANQGGLLSGGTSTPTSTFTPSSTFVPSTYAANIDFESMNSYGTYNPAALANPSIGAVDINMNWVSVEPQQGVFNWKPADNEIAAWANQGKKFTIVARFINEGQGNCNGFQLLPAWEIVRIPHFCSTTGQIIPDYFDPTFKADLKAYAQAIAQHIAASPYGEQTSLHQIGCWYGW